MIENFVCFTSINSKMCSVEQQVYDFSACMDEAFKWVVQLNFIKL